MFLRTLILISVLCSHLIAVASVWDNENVLKADTLAQVNLLGDKVALAVRVTPLVTTVGDYVKGKVIRHSHSGAVHGLHSEHELSADPYGHESWAGYVEIDYLVSGQVRTRKILVDVGSDPTVLLANAKKLKVPLKEVSDVFLTHWHYDHVQALPDIVPSLSPEVTVHVQENIFKLRKRKNGNGTTINQFVDAYKKVSENSDNVMFMVYTDWRTMVFRNSQEQGMGKNSSYFSVQSILTTGTVPRTQYGDEGSYPKSYLIVETGELDTVLDDQSLVIDTANGPVIVTGCSHSGIRNIVYHAKETMTKSQEVNGVVGGLHFFGKILDEKAPIPEQNSIKKIAQDLVNLSVKFVMAGHCSGTYRVFELAKLMGETCQRVALASVGSQFLTGKQPLSVGEPDSGVIKGGQFTKCPAAPQ